MNAQTTTAKALMSLALLGLLLSIGCGGALRSMKPAAEIPRLAALDEARARVPREIQRVPAGEAGGETIRLALERAGRPSEDRLVVLLHGVLSDRSMWRFLKADLGRDRDLLLIDMLGCGGSDRPDPVLLGPGGYSPAAQARRVLQALASYQEAKGLPRRLTLVGHSLGGSVILRLLGDAELRRDFPDLLARVDGTVLFAPMDFAVEKEHPVFTEIARLGRTKVALAAGLGILEQRVAQATMDGVDDPMTAPREGALRQIDILRNRDSRKPAQAMILQAVPFLLEERRPDWPAIEELVSDYANVQVPVLIAWGARDETLPASMGYKLQAQLPDARLRIVAASMHSLPTERPAISAELIRDFLRDGNPGPAVQQVEIAATEDIQTAERMTAQ